MDRVAEFLKVAENVGIDKGDIPDLAKAPSSLLEALEGHLANLEGRKPGSGGATPTQGGHRVNVAAAVNLLNTTSNAFGTAANGSTIDEKTAAKLLEEEAAAMEKFRENASASNPFAAAPAAAADETPNILDLFGVAAPPAATALPEAAAQPAAAEKSSDDLLQLAGNPFANMLNSAGSGAAPTSQPPFTAPAAPAAGFATSQSLSSPFVSDNTFSNVFGQQAGPGVTASDATAMFGDVMLPSGAAATNGNSKMLTGDLDSSLANLASNLNFTPSANKGLISGPARGPPMAKPAGFSPFPPQPQQQMGEQPSNLFATPDFNNQASPPAFSTQSFSMQDITPHQQTSPLLPSSQTFDNSTTSPFLQDNFSVAPDTFLSPNPPNSNPFGNGFLNNNGIPAKSAGFPASSPQVPAQPVSDQFGGLL